MSALSGDRALRRRAEGSKAVPGVTDSDELAGIDALNLPLEREARWGLRVWNAAWPKLAAVGLILAVWEAVVWMGLKPPYVLAGPRTALDRLAEGLMDGSFGVAALVTLRRAALGFALATVIGLVGGSLLARIPLLRAAVGSLITGLQTMPTIAWFPLAILLFGVDESAMMFVVVLGAAPSIANGVMSGVDHIPPLLLRAGRALGAKGLRAWRHVVLPGALPGTIAGLKQGWAFAWRSLMAGELIVIIAEQPSLGVRLQLAREMSDAPTLMATMIVILLIGLIVDSLFFARVERAVCRRRGLATVR